MLPAVSQVVKIIQILCCAKDKNITALPSNSCLWYECKERKRCVDTHVPVLAKKVWRKKEGFFLQYQLLLWQKFFAKCVIYLSNNFTWKQSRKKLITSVLSSDFTSLSIIHPMRCLLVCVNPSETCLWCCVLCVLQRSESWGKHIRKEAERGGFTAYFICSTGETTGEKRKKKCDKKIKQECNNNLLTLKC